MLAAVNVCSSADCFRRSAPVFISTWNLGHQSSGRDGEYELFSICHESHQIFQKESHTVVNNFTSMGKCRNLLCSRIEAAELVLLIIQSARRIAK